MKRNEIPQTIVAPLLDWYHRNARILPWRENRDPYRIWISEIMLQQTRVDTVIPYYNRFLSVLPDIKSLAEVPEDELMKLWEGLGYYSRARNLQKAARKMVDEFGGEFPRTPREVATLPGIGPYTTGAICSIAFELPTPAVDGNVLRVISRICRSSENIDDTAVRKKMTEQLAAIYPETERGDFTQSLMELGAIVCLPNGLPLCDRCPLSGQCAAHLAGCETDYPVKNEKSERKQMKMTVFLLRYNGKIAVCKREQSGLLAGLWQLPNTDGALTESAAEKWLAENGFSVKFIQKTPKCKHVFTHIEWQMNGYDVEVAAEDERFTWVSPEQLEQEIAFPTAFRKFL